jgi:hypothetical protein
MAIRKTNDIANETESKYSNQQGKRAHIEERFDDTTHNDNPYDDALQYLSKKIDETIDEININSSRTGARGPAGADGSDGATGPQGPTGAAGRDGTDGADGRDGGGFPFVQYNCTNTTQGIQGVNSYTIPFDQQEVISNTSDFTLDRGAITVVNAGTYEIYFGIVMYGRVVRANPLIQVYVGSTAKNIYGGAYIRNSSGHNRSISQGTGLLQLSANDSITVRSIHSSDWGASGSITMLDGTKIIIKKIG